MKSEKQNVVTDPSGRFEKIDETLSVHSNVICFKAYDTESGLEVSWYEIDCISISDEQKDTLEQRAQTVKRFKFNSLLSVFDSWFNPQKTIFYLITESVNSKSVFDQMMGEGQPLRPRTIQKWAISVLQSLDFLHHQNPPVTHNRVELSSIFIKASSKFVKLMPPLLNPYLLKNETHELRVRYTTPPEALFNKVSPASDIWSFGIAVLYGITMERPYSECNPYQFITKLRNYQLPACIEKVKDQQVKSFILACLTTPELRPSPAELLKHPFFIQNYEQPSQDTRIPNKNFEVLIAQPISPSPVNSTGVIKTVTEHGLSLSKDDKLTTSTPFLDSLKC